MKHILLTLTLFNLASFSLEAKVSTGNSPLAIHSNFSLTTKNSLNGYFQNQVYLLPAKKNPTTYQTPKTPKAPASFRQEEERSATNLFRAFIGVGNNNVISDMVTLTDKSFLGEIGWQVRGGIRLKDNYEINLGIYGRKCPNITDHPGYTYNKFSGISAAFMYEFKNEGSRWGIPFGMEVLHYTKNFKYTIEGQNFYDNYKAFSYGPKIGLRYHISGRYFLEAECEALIEKFKSDVNWGEKSMMKANKIGSLKFFGLSVNRSF